MSLIIKNVEKPIRLAHASEALADMLPGGRRAERQHLATWHRWVNPGLRGVRLEVIQIGGTACTSREAVQRFFAALSEARHPERTQTPARRQREIHRAEKACELAGI
ncbi:MAG: DUF1580 domain-containing protein [Phycisphaerae bacterium]